MLPQPVAIAILAAVAIAGLGILAIIIWALF